MTVAAGLLAHQGGWDEILLILTPIALFAGLLWLANRRADAGLRERGPGSGGGSADATPEEGPGPAPARDEGRLPAADDDGRPRPPAAGPG